MSPDQRAAAFDERIVHVLDELPKEFRNRIMETGRRLGEESPVHYTRVINRRLVRVNESFVRQLDELLDLLGAFEDVVGPARGSTRCRCACRSVVFPPFPSVRERPVTSHAAGFQGTIRSQAP